MVTQVFAYDRAVFRKTLAPMYLTTANMVVQSESRYRRRTLRRWVVMAVAGSGGSQARGVHLSVRRPSRRELVIHGSALGLAPSSLALTLWQATGRRLDRRPWRTYARCPVLLALLYALLRLLIDLLIIRGRQAPIAISNSSSSAKSCSSCDTPRQLVPLTLTPSECASRDQGVIVC
ncbi:MAG TPA: hypothetical protein VKK19_06845 [Candidatus Dormibacteraeota bacterium]|nr:hypothetical protein [Candidatus Dormibacteraeota bacterium]